jgi:DNA-binding transcriptional regulator LsrR (DeoR family)
VLRDDISQLLSSLIHTNNKKHKLFEEIYRLDYDSLHYVNTGNIDKAEDLLKYIENLKIEIQTLDFESGKTRERILETAGIDETEFNRLLEKGDHEKLKELKVLNQNIRKLLAKLIENREKLILKMEEINLNLGIDIKELELMRKIDLDKLA